MTPEQYQAIKRRLAAFEAWRNGRTSYRSEEVPAHVPQVTNEERSAVEVYEFINNPPDKYFLYIKEEPALATTWTGDKLGSVSFGQPFRDNFGGVRVPVTVHGINGRNYTGTYYKSSGDYARVKALKASK